MSDTPQHAPQQILGEYTIERRLSGDDRTERFLTRQTLDDGRDRYLVVSQLRSPHNRDTDKKRALRKAINRGRFSHPNVVGIVNVLSSSDEFIIVSEYVKGASLDEVLERSRRKGIPLSLGYVTRVITAVCDSLDYAFHAQGPDGASRRICHGQVTPANIWISMDGKVKVSNFQVGIVLREMAPPSETEYTGLFSYVSPEDAREGVRDLSSDIFSAGVILYEMTMGQPLFRRDSDKQSIEAVMDDPIAPPSSVHSDYPAGLELSLMRSLSRDRNERFSTAAQLAQGVRGSLEGHTELANRTALATFMRMLFPDRADRNTGVWQSPTYVGPQIMRPGGDLATGNTYPGPNTTGGLSGEEPLYDPSAPEAGEEFSVTGGSLPGLGMSTGMTGPPLGGTPGQVLHATGTGTGVGTGAGERSSYSVSRQMPLPPSSLSDQKPSEVSANPVTGVSRVKVFRAIPTPGEQSREQPKKPRSSNGLLVLVLAGALLVSGLFWLVIYPSL